MRKFGWFGGALWLAAAILPAQAQDEAANIKQGIEASLQTYAKLNTETIYSFAGVDVAADGGGYAVTITDVRVAPDESPYLAVGDVKFKLAAEGTDAYRVSDVVLADRMPVKRSDGTEDGALTIGSQQFTGLWSRSLGVLTEATYAYNDLKAADAAGSLFFGIGSITGTGTGTDKGNGIWDTQSSFRVAGINVTTTLGGDTVSIGAIEGSGTGKGMKMSIISGLPGRLWAILAAMDSPTPPPDMMQLLTDLYSMYAGIDGTYKVTAVSARDATGKENFALPEASFGVKADGFDSNAGKLDMTFGLKGLSVDDDGKLSIGALEYHSLTNGFKVAEYVKLMEQLQGIAAHPEQPPAPEAMIDMFAGMLTVAAGGDSELKLQDIKYADYMGNPVFSLANAGLAGHIEGMDQPMARASLTLNHQGLTATAPDPSMQDFTPTESSITFQLENLPIQGIIEQVRAAAPQLAGAPPDQQDMVAFMLMGIVQQAMAQAKTQLKLADWRIRSTAATLDLNGVIETSMESMMGAIANAKITVTGLDRVVDLVKQMSGPDSSDAAGLDVLRGYSNRTTGADGVVTDVYDVAFTPQGQLMLNGKEFPLMGPGPSEMPPQDGGTTMDPNAPPPADGTTTNN